MDWLQLLKYLPTILAAAKKLLPLLVKAVKELVKAWHCVEADFDHGDNDVKAYNFDAAAREIGWRLHDHIKETTGVDITFDKQMTMIIREILCFMLQTGRIKVHDSENG